MGMPLETLTTGELAIIWSFCAVMVVYLFSFAFVLVGRSITFDNKLLLITLMVMSFLGCLILALKYFKQINTYIILATMMVYIIAYIIGLTLILRKKREEEKAAQQLIERQKQPIEKQAQQPIEKQTQQPIDKQTQQPINKQTRR